VELLAAAAFVPEAGLPQPATRLAGFLRFLRLLGDHPWRERPLVVDPAVALGAQARREIDAAHSQVRSGCRWRDLRGCRLLQRMSLLQSAHQGVPERTA